jgi:acylphosphatase
MAAGQASTERRRIRAVVRGLVQGVAYRASTQAEAARLGLVGWVANQPDGSVVLEAEGAGDPIEALIAWCTRGPRLARVDTIEVEELPPRLNAGSFTIRR